MTLSSPRGDGNIVRGLRTNLILRVRPLYLSRATLKSADAMLSFVMYNEDTSPSKGLERTWHMWITDRNMSKSLILQSITICHRNWALHVCPGVYLAQRSYGCASKPNVGK